MEQKLRFGSGFGPIVGTEKNWAAKYASFEGSILRFHGQIYIPFELLSALKSCIISL